MPSPRGNFARLIVLALGVVVLLVVALAELWVVAVLAVTCLFRCTSANVVPPASRQISRTSRASFSFLREGLLGAGGKSGVGGAGKGLSGLGVVGGVDDDCGSMPAVYKRFFQNHIPLMLLKLW